MEPTPEQIESVCRERFPAWGSYSRGQKRLITSSAMLWFAAWEKACPRPKAVGKEDCRRVVNAFALHPRVIWDVANVARNLAKRGHLTIEEEPND